MFLMFRLRRPDVRPTYRNGSDWVTATLLAAAPK
jgi:hypothetical protein